MVSSIHIVPAFRFVWNFFFKDRRHHCGDANTRIGIGWQW
jgi:hypothetical protein